MVFFFGETRSGNWQNLEHLWSCTLVMYYWGIFRDWAASQTRSDLSYTVVELSMKLKKGQLKDLKKANKTIARLINNPKRILFPRMTGNMKLVVYSDAAYANLPDRISSG